MKQDNMRKRGHDPRNIRNREIRYDHYKEHYKDQKLKEQKRPEEKSGSEQKRTLDLSVEESLPFERMFKDGILRASIQRH